MLKSVFIAYVLPSIVSDTAFQKLDAITVCTALFESTDELLPSWPYPFPPQPYNETFNNTGVGSGVAEGEGVGLTVDVGTGLKVTVGVGLAVTVGTGLKVTVGVGLDVTVGTGLKVTVGVGLAVTVGTGLKVTVGVGLAVTLGVGLGVAPQFNILYTPVKLPAGTNAVISNTLTSLLPFGALLPLLLTVPPQPMVKPGTPSSYIVIL
jgi:hypothetical protein